jgi:hypothetical protein
MTVPPVPTSRGRGTKEMKKDVCLFIVTELTVWSVETGALYSAELGDRIPGSCWLLFSQAICRLGYTKSSPEPYFARTQNPKL